ncbi:MAG: polyprenyl glycosylphosphotransferase [Flavobacteriales bacterium]|nr:polyprenyl glycosylphosphotransferase [Flavobacteriales bacterium]
MIISICWVLFYTIIGDYKNIYRKSRLKELINTFLSSVMGTIIIFFAILIDDFIVNYNQYYFSFLVLFTYHFGLTAFLRLITTSITINKIQNKKIFFNTLIIGSNTKAIKLFNDIKNEYQTSGQKILGFINVDFKKEYLLSKHTLHLGELKSIKEIIKKYKIEDVIIAIESSEHKKISEILSHLEETSVFIKIIPDMYDILSGSVKINSIYGTPLIQIKHEILPQWQIITKNIFDYLLAINFIIIFSPIYLILGLIVKLTSNGNIIFKQKRIGKNGVEFNIYKFRSMYNDAEKNGPQLSSKKDNRITTFGRFMRKTRLDETPQFFNILKGDMSFVGPRPEREFYAKQILKIAPHYKHIYKVKPGITSWGMVKYGYAENIDEMMQRLKYDIIYIENMSLLIDLKIIIYTILIILKGKGK